METKRKVITIVEKKDDNIRVDQYLSRRFSYHTRSEWQDIIGEKLILVDGQPCKPSRIVRTNTSVEFLIDDYVEPEADTSYEIVFEDEFLLAVNKPFNSVCHPVGPYFKNTLSFKLSEDKGIHMHLINRLDRETTGIVLFGKDPKTARSLMDIFVSRRVYKEYTAAVHGDFPDSFTAEGFLTNDEKSAVRKKRKFIRTLSELKPGQEYETAGTYFELIRSSRGISLLKVIPETGRLHQIRATLCSLGYPVVGDKLYGLDDNLYVRLVEKRLTEEDMTTLIIPHQALHARKLEFEHHVTKTVVSIEVPVPQEVLSLVEYNQ